MTPVVIGGATLHRGDCIEVMRGMADASVDSIVCDPPYHLTNNGGGPAKGNDNAYSRARAGATSTGFMGQAWDGGDIAQRVEMWAECLRVLKPGGHLLAFSGTRTQHRMVCAIEDAGFEVRDQFGWAYGSGFPKSRNIAADMIGQDAEEWSGWGTAVKPAWEPICFARKPIAKGLTVAANVLQHGTGGLNIDGCRVDAPDGVVLYSSRQEASVTAFGDGLNGSNRTGETGAGRWPANIIHDGSDEVLAVFPDAAGQQGDLKETGRARPSSGRFGDMAPPHAHPARNDTGSAARFFYCAKASRADRNEGLPSSSTPAVETDATMRKCEIADWSTRNGNHHPTVKPTDLMAYLCRLVTPPSGTVLDPFMGSGSTGKAAIREGFQFIGIDMTAEYVDIATARISHEIERVANAAAEAQAAAELAARQPDLFAPEPMKQEQATMFAEVP